MVLLLGCAELPTPVEGACLSPEDGWYDDTASPELAPGEYSFEREGRVEGDLVELVDAPACAQLFGIPSWWYAVDGWVVGTSRALPEGPAVLEYSLLRSWSWGMEGSVLVETDDGLAYAAVQGSGTSSQSPVADILVEPGRRVGTDRSGCGAVRWRELVLTDGTDETDVGYERPVEAFGFHWVNAGTNDVGRGQCTDGMMTGVRYVLYQ